RRQAHRGTRRRARETRRAPGRTRRRVRRSRACGGVSEALRGHERGRARQGHGVLARAARRGRQRPARQRGGQGRMTSDEMTSTTERELPPVAELERVTRTY